MYLMPCGDVLGEYFNAHQLEEDYKPHKGDHDMKTSQRF